MFVSFGFPTFVLVLGVVVLILVLRSSCAPRPRGSGEQRICRGCGQAHPDHAAFCRRCGTKL
ncbi:MAG: zinc-ribbon domain-containing protein [Tepidisphaeraceae bacterium]